MKGWFLAGRHPQDYEQGIDSTLTYHGKNSGYLKAKGAQPGGFGTIMQLFKADDYRNKRMRFSATVKSEGTDEDWAGLWMRIDGREEGETLGFDNMQQRPIKGTTDWQKYEVVLDVPQESVSVAFGLLLAGQGQAWLSDVEFEEVSADMPTTSFEGYKAWPGKLGCIIGGVVAFLGFSSAQFPPFLTIPFWVKLISIAAMLLAIWAIQRYNTRQTGHQGITCAHPLLVPTNPSWHMVETLLPIIVSGFLIGLLTGLAEQVFFTIHSWIPLIIVAAMLLALWIIRRFNGYPAKPRNLDFAEDRA